MYVHSDELYTCTFGTCTVLKKAGLSAGCSHTHNKLINNYSSRCHFHSSSLIVIIFNRAIFIGVIIAYIVPEQTIITHKSCTTIEQCRCQCLKCALQALLTDDSNDFDKWTKGRLILRLPFHPSIFSTEPHDLQ